MKITADQIKRMSVGDLKYLERSICSWIHSRDQQRNMAATALGLLTKNFTTISTAKANRFGRVSERHSRALLDCTLASDSLSNTLKGFGAQISRPSKESKKTTWKYNLLSKKETTSDKKSPSRTHNLKEFVEKLYPTAIPTQQDSKQTVHEPQTHVNRITRVEIPNGLSDKVDVPINNNNKNISKSPERKTTPVTASTPKKAPRVLLRQRRFQKPMPLLKVVTLREHRRKCEQRVRELEIQAAKLRSQKAQSMAQVRH